MSKNFEKYKQAGSYETCNTGNWRFVLRGVDTGKLNKED